MEEKNTTISSSDLGQKKLKRSFPVNFALLFTIIAFYIFALFFLRAISPLDVHIDWRFFFGPFIRFDLVIVSLPILAIPLGIVFIFFYGVGSLIEKARSKNK